MNGPATPTQQIGGGGGGGGGAAFAFPPWDWAAGSEGFGVGAADFPAPVDLSTLDAGRAVAASGRSADNKQLWFRPTPASGIADDLAGLLLASIAAGNTCWAVRVIPRMTAAAAADAGPGTSLRVQFGIALFRGAALGAWDGVLMYANGTTPSGFVISRSTGGSRAASGDAANTGAGSYMLGQPLDFFIRRTDEQVEVAWGYAGAVQRFSTVASTYSGVGVIGVVASCETAMDLNIVVVRARQLAGFPTVPA